MWTFEAYLNTLRRFHLDVYQCQRDKKIVMVESQNEEALDTIDDMLEQLHIGSTERSKSQVTITFDDPAIAIQFCKKLQ